MPEAAPPEAVAEPPRFYFVPEMEAQGEPAKPLETFHVETIRKDFPILHQQVHGKPLIWMDNAATTQKPQAVIDAISRFYQRDYSNIHRGAHTLAGRATDAYENARKKVAGFIGAGSPDECVFVRGTTEAINLVANTWGKKFLTPGDEIVLTTLEHHANIVPWQFIAKETGAVIRVVPITDRGEVMLEEYERLLGPRTRIVGFPHVSNALGTVSPAREMAEMAHRYDARVLVDGAQCVPHMPTNMQEIDADFMVFSGHKMFGPAGVGVLYAKKELLELMPPWQGGGSMIRNVTFEHTEFEKPPAKFEAGTPTIADAVGLGAAIDYLERIGMENILRYEHVIIDYAMGRMAEIPGLTPIGTAPGKVSVLSFLLEGATPEEVGRYLDTQGIAVRAGHHCAQPTMQRFGTPSTVRPSLAFYNTHEEIDELVDALKRFPRH
jgi:cysteine desulfurase/selenocysteine lyase